MANGTQYLPTFRRGFTGPAGRIGSGTEFHIDSQILKTLPEIEKIRAMDSKARQYAQNNRVIEFSNEGVAGRTWNPDAPLEEKIQLYRAATASHAPRPGVWDRLDYYVPFKGEDRFGKSVEGASIYIPGIPGGKIRSSSGGGYGYFSEAMDPSGRVVFRVGHGDINRPEEQQEILVQDTGDTPSVTTTVDSRANNGSTDIATAALLGTFLANALQKNQKTEGPTPSENALAGMDSDKTSRSEEIQDVLKQALAEKTRAAKADRELEEQAYLYQQGQKAIGATRQRMADLLASAQKAFSPGQPVF